MIDLPIQLFAKDVLRIQPALMSQLIAFVSVAWIIKPLFGILTDLYPLYGYRRKIYIYICSFVIILSLLLITFLPVSVWHTAIILLILNMGFSFVMVLGEAIVVELSQFDPNQSNIQDKAKRLISVFFLFRYSGNLIASLIKGYLVENIGVRRVFLLATLTGVMIFAAGVILIENKLHPVQPQEGIVVPNESEDRGNSKEKVNFEDPRIQDNLTFVTMKNNSLLYLLHKKKYVISEFWAFLKKKYVYIPTIFIIIYMGTPSFSSPFFYFLINELHFKPSDFGFISFFSNVFILMAIVVYRLYLKDCNFKLIITIGTFASFFVTFLAWCLVTRANVSWGISDFLMCLSSSSILAGIGEIMLMPMLSLGCQICPKYLEATVYSFFMSTINLGGIISELSGSFLTTYYGITSKNFDNLAKMIVVTNVISVIPLSLLLFMDNTYFQPEENESLHSWEESLVRESFLHKTREEDRERN